MKILINRNYADSNTIGYLNLSQFFAKFKGSPEWGRQSRGIFYTLKHIHMYKINIFHLYRNTVQHLGTSTYFSVIDIYNFNIRKNRTFLTY